MPTRRLLPLIAVPLVALVLSGCRVADVARCVQLANIEREARGVHPVHTHPTLSAKAQAWAEHIAARGSLVHSRLSDGAGSGWRALGENLAMASSVDEAHRLLMNSSSHRSTMLSGRYQHIGVGIAWSGNRVFVVQVFGG